VIRVLFVDDDIAVLDDLRRSLQICGANWDITIATSGEEALKLIDEYGCDVIVTDMRMPGMDGAELLAIVRDEHPELMRILMSGNSDISFTQRLVPQAHQFLHKPCQPSVVIPLVERVYELSRRIYDNELKRVLGQITELPRPPQSVLRLNALLDDPEAGLEDVAEVVEQDMALTVKLFQLVNSAQYGLLRSIQDVREAVSYLGMNTVRNLAVSVEVFRTFSAESSQHAGVIQELHEHAYHVAQIARQLVLVRDQANEAFVAGLLHDVGLLAVVSYFPDRFAALHEAAEHSELPIWDLEMEMVGAHHSDLGAYLLNLWGLPYSVVEAVSRHHDAPQLPQRKMDPTHAVCIADAIVSSQHNGKLLRESGEAGLETSYLEELGVLERVAGLLAMAPAS
jgi:putative nucleotidyltransferase with HDIG domain